MDYKPPTIVREDIHLVRYWQANEYGDTIVTVADGEPIKIGKKRAKLAEKLVANTQFSFKYANYMNKDYVADLECMESAEAVAEKPKNIPEPKTIRTGRDEDKVSLRTAIMEVGQDWREGKRKDNDPLVLSRELWLMSIFQVEEATGKTEVSTPKVAVEGPDYTKEMLKNLMDAALWDAAQVATYINDKYGVKITSASKMFESLSNEQKKATLEHMDKNPKLP